jgi:hypothetical protein
MPRVTCRCGEKLKVQPDSPERIDCPKCGAKIRLRRAVVAVQTVGGAGDGFLRFLCPCGRRLKVPAEDRPVAGKCPDCGRVVPVPTSAQAKSAPVASKRGPQSDPEARTEELDADDLAQLETWGARCAANSTQPVGPLSTSTGLHAVASGADPDANLAFITPAIFPASEVKFEAGLRVCPRCKKPVHLGAAICRECGTPVPRQ